MTPDRVPSTYSSTDTDSPPTPKPQASEPSASSPDLSTPPAHRAIPLLRLNEPSLPEASREERGDPRPRLPSFKGDHYNLALVHKVSLLCFVVLSAFFFLDITLRETACDARLSHNDFDAALLSSCSDAAREQDIRTVSRTLTAALQRDPALRAPFLRAAFHDCATATQQDELSGCNGSLRFELDLDENVRLAPAVAVIGAAVNVTPCVGHADGIQLAAASALAAAGGPDVTDRVVCVSAPRRDASAAEENRVPLPGRNARARGMRRLFRRIGMRGGDLVVALAAAHNFGGESQASQEQIDDDTERQSTSAETAAASFENVTRFSSDARDRVWRGYATNLVAMADGGHTDDAEGFHSMPSDRVLIEEAMVVRRLREFSTVEGEEILKQEFGEVLVRLGRISGLEIARGTDF